jgi:hypothetical protein
MLGVALAAALVFGLIVMWDLTLERRALRVREHFPPDALEISQIRQVIAPLGVACVVEGEPCRIGVGVEQLIGHGDQRISRPPWWASPLSRHATHRPCRPKSHECHDAGVAAIGCDAGVAAIGWVAWGTEGRGGTVACGETADVDSRPAWPEIVPCRRGTTVG